MVAGDTESAGVVADDRLCFHRNQRLLTAADYRRVFQAPDHKAGQAEVLLLARGNLLSHHRLGLAVAKKHLPTAVKRNLFKRLAREHFRRLTGSKKGLDIIVLSRPGAAGVNRRAMRSAISAQFQRLLRRAGAQ
jgi:ribonuclease P protein component